jgi:hypothetical protein
MIKKIRPRAIGAFVPSEQQTSISEEHAPGDARVQRGTVQIRI